MKVSAVIITCNEAHNLRKTLNQLYWCDEIVVVDSFSTDETVEICSQFGCKVFQRVFDGYGTQKRFAIEQASHDWILSLDADEYLTWDLAQEIQHELCANPEIVGYELPMNLVFRNYEFRHGKESNRFFLRLFNRNFGGMSADKVHEGIHVNGPVKKLKNIILHYSYRDTHHYFSKMNRYTAYGAEMAHAKGKKKSMFFIAISVPFYFFKYYILERNILNGENGFYWAAFNSYYHFVKYIKTRDLELNEMSDLGIPLNSNYLLKNATSKETFTVSVSQLISTGNN